MATHLSIVNRVLRRLREDTVTGITDNDYSELIAEFVVDALEEVQDAHDWESLKHRIKVDVVAGTTVYELTAYVANGGNIRDTDPRVCTIDSELQFMNGDAPSAWLYDDNSDDKPAWLYYATPEAFNEIQAQDRDLTEDNHFVFTIQPNYNGSTEKLYLKIYPEPEQARVFEAIFWTPAPQLAVDGTTDATEVLLPDRPVFLLTLMTALNERGEEIGEPGNLAERKFINALSAAIERDIQAAGKAERYEWRRD